MLPECTCQHTFTCIVETQRGSKTGTNRPAFKTCVT
jgi:hypothetical protein